MAVRGWRGCGCGMRQRRDGTADASQQTACDFAVVALPRCGWRGGQHLRRWAGAVAAELFACGDDGRGGVRRIRDCRRELAGEGVAARVERCDEMRGAGRGRPLLRACAKAGLGERLMAARGA